MKEKLKRNRFLSLLCIILIAIILLLLIMLLFDNKEKEEEINNSVTEVVKTNGTVISLKDKVTYNSAVEVSEANFSNNNASLSFKLPYGDSSIEYTFLIDNNEDFDKIINKIIVDNPNVIYEVKGLGDGIVKADSSKTITIVFRPKNGGSDEINNVNVTFDIQPYKNNSNTNTNSNSNNTNNNSNTNTNTNTSTSNTGTSNTNRNNKKYYKVTLIDNGVAISSEDYVYGSKISFPSVSKTGYTFLYWSLGGSVPYDTTTIVTSDTVLYSVYKINTYTVDFYSDNQKIKTVTKNYGEKISISDLPVMEAREGYTVVYYKKGSTTPFDLSTGITGNTKIEAKYEKIKNEVVFNDENRITKIKVEYGNNVVAINSKGKTGYTFSHWSKTINGSAYLFNEAVTEAFTLYAVYTPNTYTITIKDENENVINTKEVTYGDTYGDLPEAPAKEGHSFDGWYTEDGTKVTSDTVVNLDEDSVLVPRYIKNNYTVTYNYEVNGGDSASYNTKEVEYESEVDLSVTSIKEGYTFVGWNTDSDATTKLDSLTMGSSDITLYAIYKTENKVIFNANNNKLTLEESEVTENNSIEVGCYAYNNDDECNITVPTISSDKTPIVIGYSSSENKHENQIDSGATITINKDGYNNKNIYYAQTYSDEITYNVTYQKEDSVNEIGDTEGTCTIAKVYNGATQGTSCEITLPNIVETTGYENGKWYDESNSYNKNEVVNINKNTEFVAKASIKKFTVTYKDYNDEVLSTEEVNYNTVTTRPSDPTREYYDFIRWSTTKNGEAYDFSTHVTDNLTLYAVYEVKHYTVTLMKDGEQISSESVEAGTVVNPEAPVKTGYDFEYWSETENGEAYNSLIPLNDNLTLYAVYSIHAYKIKFFNNDELLKEINKNYNTNFVSEDFPNADKEGYTISWHQLNMTDPYDLSKAISSDLSLYITYTKIKNGVIFEDQLNQNTVEVEYGDKVTAVEPSGKVGHTFSCWSETSDCTNPFDFNSEIKSSITLHAVYTANTYTITIKDENENVIDTKEVTYGDTYGELPSGPVKEGHTFDGWYIKDGNKITSDTIVDVTSNTDLEPRYTVNSYTVTYNYSENGGSSSTKVSDEINYNEQIDLTVEAYKADYTFVGWNTDSSATTKLDTLTMGTSNVTLYAIYKIVNKVSFNANNNKLTLNEAEVTGDNDYDVSCEAFNNSTSCNIVVPTISSTTTPNVIGYSDSIINHTNIISSGATITINSTGYNNINKYYAQTSKDSITYNITYQKESSVAEIGKENDSCTIDAVYNSAEQATSCEITLPYITETEGYNSGKWYDGLNSYDENTTFNLTDNKELVAKAIINTYTVSYKDYDESDLSTENVNHGSVATRPSDPSRTNYNFLYWSTSKTGSEYNFNTPVTDNLTLYAVYDIIRYTITYINEGTTVSSGEVEIGTALVPPTVSKTGYDLIYWSETENGEEYTNLIADKDLTLYAVYQKHKYIVTFNDENDTKISDIKVEYLDTIDTTKVPSTDKEGYTFDGWFLTGSSEAFDLTTETITSDITLTKKYTKIKNGVTFDDEGRTTSSEVEYGDTVSEIASQGKTGYTFSCWSETSNCANAFNFNTPITSTKTLHAVYTPNEYTVTFKNESGNTVSTKTVTYDSPYGDLPAVPDKVGYTADGWYIGNDKIISSTVVKITTNTDVLPRYNINSYTLTIKNENGSSNITQSLDYNETYTLTEPSKTGYTFANWTVDGNGSSVNDNTFTMGYQDTTITANYTANSYLITLNNNEATTSGTEYLYEKYEDGFYLESTQETKVNNITIPTKTGYTFDGYYDGLEEVIDNEGNILISNTKYTTPKTVVAKWNINSYTLTINRNNGTTSEVVTLDYNATKTISDPTKTGYTFTEWTLVGTNSSLVSGTFTMGTENATLTANYNKNQYQVSYNGNGNTSGTMSNSSHIYDEAKNLTKNQYVRNGYTFIGWNTDSSASTAEYQDEEEVTNLSAVNNGTVTLYAIWSINSYTVTVNPNSGTYEGLTTNTVYNNVQYSSTKTITNPSKTGYDFGSWTVTGAGSSINNTTFTMGYENTTLTANYNPHVYTITLDQTGTTTNGTTAIYFKYNTGYYKDAETTNLMSTSANDIVVPEKYGYIFNGYYTGQNGTGTKVIDNQGYYTGNLTNTQYTSNQTLYASYTQITASMINYTDTHSMGCTNVECALDKLYEKLN